MDFASFEDGFLSTLRWCAPELADLRREVARADLDGPVRAALGARLAAFWDAHGADILFAPGIPGLNRDVAWQAGHDLAIAMSGRGDFGAAEWRAGLAGRLRAAARTVGRLSLSAGPGGTINANRSDR